MKKLVFTLSCLLAASGVRAQTNQILFANDNASLISNAFTGALVVSNDMVRAQLYVGPQEAGTNEFLYSAVGAPADVVNGRYLGGFRSVPGALPGAWLWIQVRAYEFLRANSYEEALTAPHLGGRGALVGKSAAVLVQLGPVPPAAPPSAKVVGPFGVNASGGGAFLRVNDIA